MNYISITYTLVWRLKEYKHIQFTNDLRKCFNTQTGTQKKMYKGIWVTSKIFISTSKIKEAIEKIPKTDFIYDDLLINLHLLTSQNIKL